MKGTAIENFNKELSVLSLRSVVRQGAEGPYPEPLVVPGENTKTDAVNDWFTSLPSVIE